MAGIGIGVGVGLGGGGGGAAWSETAIAAALATNNLTDAQARARIGNAASLAAGLRQVGLLPASATPSPTPAPTPAVTPLPAGVAALWDPASLAGLADDAPVTSWTDAVGGSVAVQTGDSGASHSFVASSGGLPAVRLSGAAVLVTSGTNAAATALTGGERGIIVVARAIQTAGSGQANPCLVSAGTDPSLLLQATPDQTGRYGAMYECADAGVRTIGYSSSASAQLVIDAINGTALIGEPYGNRAAGGQVAIGGWQNAGTRCCGRADVLAVIVFDRAVTAADFKQVHRRYCELTGQARPGGAAARHVTFLGDSLTAGYLSDSVFSGPAIFATSYPHGVVAGLGLAWGTFDYLGRVGYTWPDIIASTMPMLGNVSGVTGTRHIVCAFEFANMRTSAGADVAATARQAIDALHAQDPDREVIFGTSTDDGSADGIASRQHRADYDAYWEEAGNRGGIAAYIPLHLDPTIGVQGTAPTDGAASAYYQADNLHLTPAGYALVDNGPHGFRAAVQARLAAA